MARKQKQIRFSPQQRRRYEAAAAALEIDFTKFICRAADALADKVLREKKEFVCRVDYGNGIVDTYQIPPEINEQNPHDVARWLLRAVYDSGGNALDLSQAGWSVEEA